MVLIVVALAIALTVASFAYNLATGGQASRPSGLSMINAGGFDTRYRAWGTTGSAVVLVPGAFETADTFASLGAVLGRDHRVFAIDLSGTGYRRPSAPFDAGHLAGQLLAFLAAEGLTCLDRSAKLDWSTEPDCSPLPGQEAGLRRFRYRTGVQRWPKWCSSTTRRD